MSTHPELPERDRRILGALVQAYIDHGEPISSLWLASRGFGVSSATLRNILARLEEQGYVRQPHTSAGRVPTDLATARTSISCWPSGVRRGRRRRSRRGCGAPAPSRTCCRTPRRKSRARRSSSASRSPPATDGDARASRLRAARRREDPGRRRLDRRAHLAQGHRAGRGIRPDVAAAGRQLPEQRVQGPVAARGAAGDPGAAARRAQPLRRADGARAAAGEHDVRGHDVRAVGVHPGHVAAARGCRGPRARTSRSRRCARCCG